MFIKYYQYKIKSRDFQKWKKIMKEAQRLYVTHGGGNSERMMEKKGAYITIIEIDRYRSNKEYEKITTAVDADLKLDALFKDFLKLVHNKRIRRETFESV